MSNDEHHDAHDAPLDGGHGGHGADNRLQATPNPPPRGAEDSPHRAIPQPTGRGGAHLRTGDGILRPIQDSGSFPAPPDAEALRGSHIDG